MGSKEAHHAARRKMMQKKSARGEKMVGHEGGKLVFEICVGMK